MALSTLFSETKIMMVKLEEYKQVTLRFIHLGNFRYRLGPSDAPNIIEMYLDYNCPYSKKAFETMYEHVMPSLEKKFPGKVQFMFRHQVQPWHPQSTCLHEVTSLAAIAAHKIDSSKFYAYSALLFKNMDKYFDKNCWNMSREQIYESLSGIAQQCQISKSDFLNLLSYQGAEGSLNGGNQVTNDLKIHIRIARQASIHVSPTALWNGLIDNNISSSWTLQQWEEYVAQRV